MDNETRGGLIALLNTFEKAKLVPILIPHPDGGLHACTACGTSVRLVDEQGLPWHRRCKYQSAGVDDA